MTEQYWVGLLETGNVGYVLYDPKLQTHDQDLVHLFVMAQKTVLPFDRAYTHNHVKTIRDTAISMRVNAKYRDWQALQDQEKKSRCTHPFEKTVRPGRASFTMEELGACLPQGSWMKLPTEKSVGRHPDLGLVVYDPGNQYGNDLRGFRLFVVQERRMENLFPIDNLSQIEAVIDQAPRAVAMSEYKTYLTDLERAKQRESQKRDDVPWAPWGLTSFDYDHLPD